jgi:hypothetical protein
MKDILLLGSPHGDELLGDLLYRFIVNDHPTLLPHVDFMIGNPKAKAKKVRFIESDLNRSFNGNNNTYEERRAAAILRKIRANNYDLVLDLHTTTCRQPPCLIAVSTSQPFIASSSITTVVHMNHEIAKTSLIGVCEAAISIEVNKDRIDEGILRRLCDDMERFLAGKHARGNKNVYEVTGLLRKSELTEAETLQLENFKRSSHGFYPVLVGENSYKKHTEYLGFKASTPYQIGYNRR